MQNFQFFEPVLRLLQQHLAECLLLSFGRVLLGLYLEPVLGLPKLVTFVAEAGVEGGEVGLLDRFVEEGGDDYVEEIVRVRLEVQELARQTVFVIGRKLVKNVFRLSLEILPPLFVALQVLTHAPLIWILRCVRFLILNISI